MDQHRLQLGLIWENFRLCNNIFLKRILSYLQLSSDLMNPNSHFNQSINPTKMDNLNFNQEQFMVQSKSKTGKQIRQISVNSNCSIQKRSQQLFQLQNQMISKNQHSNQSGEIMNQKSQHEFERDQNQCKQSIYQGTNYSTEKSLSDQRKESFSENEENDEPPQTIAKRKERKTLCQKSTVINEQEQDDYYDKRKWKQSTQRRGVSGNNSQVVTNLCNEVKREFGQTHPVRESNTDLVGLIGQLQTNGLPALGNLFHRQDGEMVENQRISHKNQSVQNKKVTVQKENVDNLFYNFQVQFNFTLQAEQQQYKRRKLALYDSLERICLSVLPIQILYMKASKNGWCSKRIPGFKSSYVQLDTKPVLQDPKKKSSVMTKIRIISLNVDTYIERKDFKYPDKYLGVNEQQRISQIIQLIKSLMIEGVDFILLQEVASKSMRKSLCEMLKKFNSKKNGGKYHYSKRLQENEEEIATVILTKHDVTFGQFKFEIQNSGNSNQTILPFSKQSYCEFTMLIEGNPVPVCIFNCHLISNRNQDPKLKRNIRFHQIDAINHFLVKYKRTFLIGDMNIGDSEDFNEDNQYITERHFDAANYKLSELRGTYLHKKNGKIVEDRLDRVMINKESASTTSIQICYRDQYLQFARKRGLDRKQVLLRNKVSQYITLSDHTMLDIIVTFKN